MRRAQVSVQDILRKALPEGARRRIYSTDLVSRKWEQIVGNELAQRSEPEALRDGVLTVRVTDPVWGKMIYRLQDRIVPEVNRVLGARKVRRINFTKRARLEHPAPPRPTPAKPERVDPPPSIVAAGEAIEDPELRRLVLRSAARYLNAQDKRRRK